MSTGLVTPADWANITSRGSWVCMPHLDLINRKLADVMVSRINGVGSNLLVLCPPQHGKTTLVSHAFPGVWLGYLPADNVGLIGYEADFAAKRGRDARDRFDEFAPLVFPPYCLDPDVAAIAHWGVKDFGGTMSTFGAGGGITGSPMDLLILDDPIKGEEQAYSENFRETQWEWFTGTVMSRVRQHTCMVMIYTAWHEDDLGQRIIHASLAGNLEPWDVLRIPAISETQEARDEYAGIMGLPAGLPDPVGRSPGEALWPAMWPIEKLEMRRRSNAYQFEAMFQGRPRPKGGAFFKRDWFPVIGPADIPRERETCRFWDKAASEGKGDWTSGTRLSRSKAGKYFVEHVARERLSPHRRDQLIIDTANDDDAHCDSYRVRSDIDPGSAGKSEADAFCRMLDRLDVKATRITGDKESRARPFAAAAERGDVSVVRGDWNAAFFDELEAFPRGKHDDQVDSTAGAYNELAGNDQALRIAGSPFAGYQGRIARDDAPAHAASRHRRRSPFRMVGLG